MGSEIRLVACIALLGTFLIEDPFYCAEPPDHRQLAIAQLEQGNFDQALMSARRATRQHRNDGSLYLIVALAHLGREQTKQAFAALEQAVLHEPDNEQIHATLRQVFLQEGRFDVALQVYQTFLDQHPESHAGQAGLGWAHLRLGNQDQGVSLLEQAIASGDSSVFARIQLSRIYGERDSLEQATRLLTEAVDIDPDSERLLLALGESHLRQGDSTAAGPFLHRALSGSEQPDRVATHIAQLYYAVGLRQKAIEFYEMAVAIDPGNIMVLNNLAWTYAEAEIELERALELSLRSLKSDAENVVYLDTYAELLHKTGEHHRAIALICRALEFEPEDGEHYAYLQEQMEKFRLASSSGF